MISLEKVPAKKVLEPVDFPSLQKDKNRWPLSFFFAGSIHLMVFFGGQYAWVQAADYGIQGSAASMEIYMVAALPEQVESVPVESLPEEKTPQMPEGKSEMSIAQLEVEKPKVEEKKPEETRPDEAPKTIKGKDAEERSDVKGDGSSPVPGQSAATLFSRGSSETQGKEGKYLNPPPQYPALAERNGWQGVVMVKALIEKEGKPSKVVLEKSSGHRILDETAVSTVKNWKFTPGHVGNIEISSWIKIPIRFELE